MSYSVDVAYNSSLLKFQFSLKNKFYKTSVLMKSSTKFSVNVLVTVKKEMKRKSPSSLVVSGMIITQF